MDDPNLQMQELDAELIPTPDGPISPPRGGLPIPDRVEPSFQWPPWRPPSRPRRIVASGRYQGGETIFGGLLLRSLLELRIDVDSASPNVPVMHRVSGDMYRVQPSIWPGSPAQVYLESWIVDAPQVSAELDQLVITGSVRWWRAGHAPTTVRIVIQRTFLAPGPAVVTLSEGVRQRTFTCAKRSPSFRDVELELDVCQSVDAAPILPGYDTHAVADRPPALTQRTLTIEEAYREAGVKLTISPDRTIVDDRARAFASWSPAELHDAMESHYSRFGQPWPAWRLWGLLAGRYDDAAVAGIMFDASAQFGGAGRGPERQGFAVFRNHPWFADLPAGAPSTPAQAAALRQYLYCYVHEAGHAFNLLHSWNKGRPDALSWMNYPQRFDMLHGPGSFWANFEFRFDDQELIHIRHGDRASVIMGGDPWSSGGHLESPPGATMTEIGDAGALELLVRAKRHFEFMEPVSVELRVRNRTAQPVEIDARLTPESGAVALLIRRPDGRVLELAPILCELGSPELRTLAPAGVDDGTDRYSQSAFIGYHAHGFVFDVPGEYLVRAVYQGLGDVIVPSNTFSLRVGVPTDREQDAFADEYFTHDVGLSLYLNGSLSPFLAKGMETLARAREEFAGSMLGARAAETLGRCAGRSFFRLQEPADEHAKLVQAHKPDPGRQLELTAPALETYRSREDPHLNLAYHRLVRERAAAHAATGDRQAASEELTLLAEDLATRGVNRVVLADIRDAAEGVSAVT
jgi:hypothetical protein